jgi:hypothetical protein
LYLWSHIYNQKSKHIDFKGLAEVINKLIFNNLHNPPPTKYFDIIREKFSACNPASMPQKELGTISAIYGPIFN